MRTSTTRQSSKKKSLIAAALAFLLLAGGGTAAYAYWTSIGSGTGTATTGTSSSIVVNQTSTVSNLRPGAPAQALSGNFTNNTGSNVYVTSIAISVTVTKAAGAAAGTCDASDYTITGSPLAVGADIPTGTGVGSWSGATIAFNNKGTNQDQCKGATVTLAYAAS
ncbi:hypothetical protein [Microbacterium sp. 1.5R]|uniref:hypothetical protein n=1 Tax=Microbacterium sp. 1.5R TaxID=1916917 RepID=UPI0011A5EC45|nr:hypothetical protein [Microbacterium sp. 1.5R]